MNKRGFGVYTAVLYVFCAILLFVLAASIFVKLSNNNASSLSAYSFYLEKNTFYGFLEKDLSSMTNALIEENTFTYSSGTETVRISATRSGLIYERGLKRTVFKHINNIELSKLSQFCYKESGDTICKPTDKLLEVFVSYVPDDTSRVKGDLFQSRRGFYIENFK